MSAPLALSPSNAVSVRFAVGVSHFRYRQSPETSDITFVQTVQSLQFTTFVIFRNPSKSLPLLSLATADAATIKMATQKDRTMNREVKTRGLFTHSQPAAINSNLHNTSHNTVPDLVWCFPTWFYDVFRGNNGDSPMTQDNVVNAGWRRIEWHGHATDYAGLNGCRPVRMAPDYMQNG